jgi:hypothetical protein
MTYVWGRPRPPPLMLILFVFVATESKGQFWVLQSKVKAAGEGARPTHTLHYSNSIFSNPKPCSRLVIVEAAFCWAVRKMPSARAASRS